MRVTNDMISKQVIFNLQRNISRLITLQNQMSTNRRINKISDDPIGTVKDLSYRDRLTEMTQFKSNISMATNWLDATDAAVADMNEAVRNAHSIAVEMTNDVNDSSARQAAADEVQSILDQVLGSGNAQLQSSYLFSGYRTRTQPFEAVSGGVVYRGDAGSIEHTIDVRAKIQVNSVGSNLLTKAFQAIGHDANINLGINGATTLASLHLNQGVDLTPGTFEITDRNRNLTGIIDISGATDVQGAINLINTQLNTLGITNLTASLGAEGNNIRLIATSNQLVSNFTALSDLNQGTGVDMDPGTFVIRNQTDTIRTTIDLTGAATLGDVITKINSQLSTAGVNNVTASINASNTGIEITDTNGVPLNLMIQESTTADNTARNLGILGTISPTLNGANLDPRPSFRIAEAATGQTTAADLGILGNFNFSQIGEGLEPQVLPTSLLSQISNGIGMPRGEIRISHGELSQIINTNDPSLVTVQDLLNRINNSGLAITASINSAGTGIQIANNDPTRTLMVTNEDDNRVASKLGISDAADVLSSLILLTKALREDDRDTIGQMVGTVNEALNQVLQERSSIGAKVIRVESTLNRLEEYEVFYTKLLSDVEDADITKLVTDLAMQENAYKAALNSAAKIIQPSLLDFIS